MTNQSEKASPSPQNILRLFLPEADGLPYDHPSLHQAFYDVVAKDDPVRWGVIETVMERKADGTDRKHHVEYPVVGGLDFDLAHLTEQGIVKVSGESGDLAFGVDVQRLGAPADPSSRELFSARDIREQYEYNLDEFRNARPRLEDVAVAFLSELGVHPQTYRPLLQGAGAVAERYGRGELSPFVAMDVVKMFDPYLESERPLSVVLDFRPDPDALYSVDRRRLRAADTPSPEAVFVAREAMDLVETEGVIHIIR